MYVSRDPDFLPHTAAATRKDVLGRIGVGMRCIKETTRAMPCVRSKPRSGIEPCELHCIGRDGVLQGTRPATAATAAGTDAKCLPKGDAGLLCKRERERFHSVRQLP